MKLRIRFQSRRLRRDGFDSPPLAAPIVKDLVDTSPACGGVIYSASIILILFILFLLTGCGKDGIKPSDISTDEQFDLAKNIFDKKDYYKAKMQFTVLVLNNPGSAIIEVGQYYLAECHFFLKEYLLAIAEYEKLIKSLPQSSYVDDARYKTGLCYEKLSPGYGLDQEYTTKAILQYQQFLEDYPNSELIPVVEARLKECRDKLAKKEFMTGELYRKMGYFSSAVISFVTVLNNYNDTQYADDALYWKGECLKKNRQFPEAREAFELLITRYPESSFVDPSRQKIQELVRAEK